MIHDAKCPDHTVDLGYNETVDIHLPDGRVVNVLLSYLEPGNQYPELDIMLPKILSANCFGEDLKPAEQHSDDKNNVLLSKQIIVPLD